MEMLSLSLPATNRFASNYLEQTPEIMHFFHYRYNDAEDDKKRIAELETRSFPREETADHIKDFMTKYTTSSQVDKSLEKLRQPNSVVVIGGQQAGILTGPLYTIHKLISIIKLAEQKEKALGIPVVPVFWIAGEDHDFHEVNHIFTQVGQKAEKRVYPEKIADKKMISDITLNKDVCLDWAKGLLEGFGETDHTSKILSFLERAVEEAETFVDFFAILILELFKDTGLLILDSGNPGTRQLEKDILQKQILQHQSITHSLFEQQKELGMSDYPNTIEVKENAANLFYYDYRLNERILLDYDHQQDQFVGKNGAVCFSKNELVEIALHHPEKLSNNVVTRPLTQELLFPTLAFIAGPGEISYWAELKRVFEKFEIKMPPIVPRLNITLLDRSTEADLVEMQLSIETVLKDGTARDRQAYLDSQKDPGLSGIFQDARENFLMQYKNIEGKLKELDKGLLPLLKKNEAFIIKQIEFMESKVDTSYEQTHRIALNKFTRIDLSLKPNGLPQERVWNIFQYLNSYGLDLVSRLLALDFQFDGSHKIIKM